jgi:ribonuclease P protein component
MVNKKKYSLPKKERLSWKRHIDLLFEKGQSFIAFPLRVVYLQADSPTCAPVAILTSVSKKKIKSAVGRNRIKRQIRESYRVRKYELVDAWTGKNKSLFLAFLYIDKKIQPTYEIEKSMTKAIKILQDKE